MTGPGAVTGRGLAAMSPFTVLAKEQRIKRATEPAPPSSPPPGPGRWPAYAACRGQDPELFQPISESGPYLAQIEDAKAVCRACPALAFCEAWALSAAGPDSGVLAAMSAQERKTAKRRAARQRQAEARGAA